MYGRDWTKDEDYEDCAAFSNRKWAWEFIRRSHDYLADWEDASEPFKLGDKYHTSDWIQGQEQHPDGGAIVAPNDPRLFIRSPHAERWGLWAMIPPWQDKPGQICFLERFNSKATITMDFDLEIPLEPQLEKLKSYLVGRQQGQVKHPKKVRDMWPTYLRALDGKAAGAKHREIAGLLIPHHQDGVKTVGDWLRAARRFQADPLTIARPYGS
ncbi:MAG: DUF2285 domain-containing protein [Pseudodesulfovibrio sp.]|uniref:DNA -binding domain-containing protein n=1 Tax=Pseudodesulfovibrio sp. TaxID=2035812 RepID=UPI003D152532